MPKKEPSIMQKELSKLNAKLDKILHLLQPAQRNKPLQSELDKTHARVKQRVLTKVTDLWNLAQEPTEMSYLNQALGKLLKYSPRNIESFVIELQAEKKLHTLAKLTQAKLVFPFEAYQTLNSDQIRAFETFRLSDATIKRLGKNTRTYTQPLTAAEEAQLQAELKQFEQELKEKNHE